MKRLIDELGSSGQRDVLASSDSDLPRRPEAKARALAAALSALDAPLPTDAPKPLSESPPAPGAAASGLGATVAKAVAVATIALGGTALVVGMTTSKSRAPASSVSVTPPQDVVPGATAAVPAEVPSTSPDPKVEAAPVRVPSAASSTAKPEDSLAREVRTVAAARSALAAGDPEVALRHLDLYDRIPNAHALKPEARVLRLEALAKAGREKEARILGTTLRGDPEMKAYTRRIDAVLGAKDGGS